MRFPILSGIYTDSDFDFRTALPVNMEPILKVTGISEGYLRTSEGIDVLQASAPGIDRGGINWNGVCYRVLGSKFCSVSADGSVTQIGDVGTDGKTVSMSYGFHYLAIASNENLFLYDGTTLTQNTDADLGVVLDVQWIDGYFMMTDGENLVVTELGNPFSVNPLKYGSSEVDPDPIKAVVRLNNEVYAVNRNTIEAFDNIGGQFFPFQVISGTQIYRGAVGTHTADIFMGGIAFLGSGQNEEIAVHIYGGGGDAKISTRQIDIILRGYTETQLSQAVCETRVHDGRQIFYIHLADQTLCYDGPSSQALGQPVWFVLKTNGAYLARHFVRCYDKWIVGNPKVAELGVMTPSNAEHWGDTVTWEFTTPFLYNEGKGGQIHSIELACIAGGTTLGENAQVAMEYTNDGAEWSAPRRVSLGESGDRAKPIKWMRCGMFHDRRALRFTGDSNAVLSAARVEGVVEPLAW